MAKLAQLFLRPSDRAQVEGDGKGLTFFLNSSSLSAAFMMTEVATFTQSSPYSLMANSLHASCRVDGCLCVDGGAAGARIAGGD